MKIGIDLGGTKIKAGYLKDNIISETFTAKSPSICTTYSDSIEYLKSFISNIITPEVKAIGIGVPSVVDVDKGIVYNAANIPLWEEAPIKSILEEEFKIPTFINNDSNCFTLGEKMYGEGVGFSEMVGVTLGTGVGAGIIVNNLLYNGVNTGAGEIGSLNYMDANYERYCSSEFFSIVHSTTGKETADLANNGDSSAIMLYEEFGSHIGSLVKAIMYTYDPQLIVFGGGLASAFDLFRNSMLKEIKDFPYPEAIKKIQIKVSKNDDISLLGAAALVNIK